MKAFSGASRSLEVSQWHSQRELGVTIKRTVPIRVLFIGNSYTYVNNLPQMIADLAQAAGGATIEYDTHVVGGATLELHWNDGTALAKIKQGNWDFVVLQEQSQRPIFDRDAMNTYARLFATAIHEVNAIPLFYMTWARQNAPQTQTDLSRAYMAITREVHGEVAPVGLAWQASLKQYPQLVLHQADGSHPDPTGSYLAACVFYASIFDTSPQGLPGHLEDNGQVLVDLDAATAANMQQIAWQTVMQIKQQLAIGWKPAGR